MREFKHDTEPKKATDAFFDEYPPQYSPLQNFAGNPKLTKAEDDCAFEQKPLVNYLSQALLFFPGTFVLFFLSLGATLAATDISVRFNRDDFFSGLFVLVCLIGFLSILMTWLGLGEIRNRKHFVISGSIIAAGIFIGAITRATDGLFWISQKIIDDFGYAIWLFPVALIVPILAKGWVDSISDS